MKKVEVLRNKGYSITMDEELFRSKMENLQRELNQPTQYKARLNELAALVRMQEDKPAEVIEPLDDESLEAVHSVRSPNPFLTFCIVSGSTNCWNCSFNRNREKRFTRSCTPVGRVKSFGCNDMTT